MNKLKMSVISATMVLSLPVLFVSGKAWGGEYKIDHSKSSETPNPSMEDTVKWLNGYLGKECSYFYPKNKPVWRACIDYSFEYRANPPTLVVHGLYTNENEQGKPFDDPEKSEGVVPQNAAVNLGLIDKLEYECKEDNSNYILPYYPETEGHDGLIDTGLSPRGHRYHLLLYIDKFRGKPKVRCEKVFRAIKHLAEHAPRQVWKKELF